jgi:predicted transcriptional regulator
MVVPDEENKIMNDARRDPDKKGFKVTELYDTHREIMRMAVTGMKQADIARELGVSEVMVSYTMNSPIVKREMELMRSARDLDAVDVAKRIQEVAPRALEVLEDLLETANDSIRFRAATDVLDRAGHAAVKTLRTESLSVHLNKEDLEEIKQRAREIGLCVDVDVENVTI